VLGAFSPLAGHGAKVMEDLGDIYYDAAAALRDAEERWAARAALEAAENFVAGKMAEWTRTRPRTYAVSHEEMAVLAMAVRRWTEWELRYTLPEALYYTAAARAAVIRHTPWLDPWRGVARDPEPEAAPERHDAES